MKFLNQIRCNLLLSIALIVFAGLATPQAAFYHQQQLFEPPPAKVDMSRWLHHYQLGQQNIDAADWHNASLHFEAARNLQPIDQRRLHVTVEQSIDNFARRELGIAFYHLRRHHDAITELESSLRSVDSAKTRFYLKKAYRAHLNQTGGDMEPPKIVMKNMPNGMLTNQLRLQLIGYAKDDQYISNIEINGNRLYIDHVKKHVEFKYDIMLNDGPNVVEILASDLFGNTKREQFVINTDLQGPALILSEIKRIGKPSEKRFKLHGFVADHHSLRYFSLGLGQEKIWHVKKQEHEFLQEVTIQPGETSIPFEAKDSVGNITRGEIKPHLLLASVN